MKKRMSLSTFVGFQLQVVALLAAALLMTQTMGKTCKEITAETAVTLQQNVDLGGHVWIHVRNPGNINSADVQQVGKSMFLSCADFHAVWNKWKSTAGGKTCSNKDVQECIRISQLPGTITNFVKCTSVTDGVCDEFSDPIRVEAVRFSYAKGKTGKLILNTCWPSEKIDC
jgi:hypothetical protein